MEILFIDIILSFFVTFVFIGKIAAESNINLILGTGATATIFFVINIYMLRNMYMDIESKFYFISNYIAYFIFVAVNIMVCRFLSAEVYTVLFGITKFVRFIPYNISNIESAALFHGVMFVIITIIPLIFRGINDDLNEFIEHEEMLNAIQEREDGKCPY